MAAIDDAYRLLEIIIEQEGAKRVPDVAGMTQEAKREAYNVLASRGWVDPTYYQGDFEMMQGRVLEVTDKGRAALRERLQRAENDDGTTSSWSLDERKRNREALLEALHQAAGGSTGQPIDSGKEAVALGFTELQARGLRNDLRGRGLITIVNTAGYVLLTGEGVDEAERLINPPRDPAPTSSVAFGDHASNVIIQQGSQHVATPMSPPPRSDGALARAVRFVGRHLGAFIIGTLASLAATILAIRYLSDDEPVTLRIVNEVTDGATNMREDDQPIWLSSEPTNACAADPECSIRAPDLTTGTHVRAECDAVADQPMTNGMTDDPIDDNNPNLRSSRRWYGVQYRGELLFINEVFTEVIGGSAGDLRLCDYN